MGWVLDAHLGGWLPGMQDLGSYGPGPDLGLGSYWPTGLTGQPVRIVEPALGSHWLEDTVGLGRSSENGAGLGLGHHRSSK